jgi:hypothetical protein
MPSHGIVDLIEPFDPLEYLQPVCPCPPGMVRRITLVVFDDVVGTTVRITNPVSSDELAHLLGMFDALAIEAVTDQATTGSSLSVQIQHSADGEHWMAKAASPEVPTTALNVGQTTVLPIGYDDGSLPSLALVRFKLVFQGGSPAGAAIKVTVTTYDRRDRELDEATAQLLARLHEQATATRSREAPAAAF